MIKRIVPIFLMVLTLVFASRFGLASENYDCDSEIDRCETWIAQVVLRKSAIPKLIESSLKENSEPLERLVGKVKGAGGSKTIGPIKIDGALTDLDIDFAQIKVKKIPQEQLIREDSAIGKKASIQAELKFQQGVATALQMGQGVKKGVCFLGQCVSDLFTAGMEYVLGESDGDYSYQDPKLGKPGRLENNPMWLKRMATVEALYAGREEYQDHFHRLPQAQRGEYEVRIPIRKLAAAVKLNRKQTKPGQSDISQSYSLELQSTDSSSLTPAPPELVLRFSLGENGQLIRLKYEASDGSILSGVQGGSLGLKSDPSYFNTSLSVAKKVVDTIATPVTLPLKVISEDLGLDMNQMLKDQLEGEVIKRIGKGVENFLTNTLESHIQSAKLDLDVDALKIQNLLSNDATAVRLKKMGELQNKIKLTIEKLLNEKPGKNLTGKLKDALKTSPLKELQENVSKYSEVIENQIKLTQETPSQANLQVLEKIRDEVAKVNGEFFKLQASLPHSTLLALQGVIPAGSGYKKAKKIDDIFGDTTRLEHRINETINSLEPKMGKERMIHDLNLVVSDLDHLNFGIKAYVDQKKQDISCSERHARVEDEAFPDQESVMRVSLRIDQMNEILSKYHEAKVFDICALISLEKDQDCHDGKRNKLRLDFIKPPQIAFDTQKKSFYLAFGEVQTKGMGLAKPVANIAKAIGNTRIYFSFEKCVDVESGQPSVCVTPKALSEKSKVSNAGLVAGAWLDTIRGQIIKFGITKKIKKKLPSEKVDLTAKMQAMPMAPSQVTQSTDGLSVFFKSQE